MTAPAEKLVELLETLPPPHRQEITAWLLGRAQPTTPPPPSQPGWFPSPDLRATTLGATLPAGEGSQLVTFRLPADRHAELRAWCAEHGFTMAAVVRGLIERFLEDQQRR